MAGRTKTPTLVLADDFETPDGCEKIQAERKIGEEKQVVSAIVPKAGNANGLRNWISAVTKAAEGNVEYNGVDFATGAIRTMVLAGQESADSTIIPAPSEPRTIDPAEVAGNKMAAFVREHGRTPNPEELVAMFGELTE